MRLHTNATLTIKQRQAIKRLHYEQGWSYRKLAARFGVNLTAIQRWVKRDSPLDLSTAPKTIKAGLSEEQKKAIIKYRKEEPNAGERTIAFVLSKTLGSMSHATIGRFLKAEGLTSPPVKKPRERKPLKVGKHRLQMDIQQLPAVRGGEGFEYKVTLIHMATRLKYSEIHSEISSEIVAKAVQNALGHMPPFFFNMDG